MKKRYIKKNNEGQVLGLPMYLIIVMIVAVAVIAAVIYMIPQGTQTMISQVTVGSVISDGAAGGTAGSWAFSVFDVTVEVKTNDDRRDPIVGATVRLSGGHAVAEVTTDADGIAQFDDISGAYLDANINEAFMKLTVKASGFEDFEDDSAVMLFRP